MKTNGWTFACVVAVCLTVGTILDEMITAGVFQ